MYLNVVTSDIGKYLQDHPWAPEGKLSDINNILPNLITTVLAIAGVVFLIFLIIGGIQWMTAGGDQEAITKAKSRLTNAVIGIVIVFSAWAILNLVNYFFGINNTSSSPPSKTCNYSYCKAPDCSAGCSSCSWCN
tara:strand:+ start:298 stop:702 length:405 start_codon:yes stop_codon:yes gene_type:complete